MASQQRVRIEKLSHVAKVVSSPEGNLELVVVGGGEPLRVEAGLFVMDELQAFFALLAQVHMKVGASGLLRAATTGPLHVTPGFRS